MSALARAALIALLGVTAGCATEPAFENAPSPGSRQAVVYLYRLDTWPEVRSDSAFSLNGVRVATLRANRYTWFHLPEGHHRLEQVWEKLHPSPAKRHDFSVRAGQTYYLRLNVEGGTLQTKWWMTPVPVSEARGELAKCGYQPAIAASK